MYTVQCSYPDKGFSITDIYGFCSRGNSNKSTEKGQEGIYGIGIKSLFCFANYLSIENNIKIELSSRTNLLDTIHISNLKELPGTTKFTFKFEYDKENDDNNKHASFNVKKLADFIDALCSHEDPSSYFYSTNDNELLFDPRSLIFTELRNGRKLENSIKTIQFSTGDHSYAIGVQDELYHVGAECSIIKISKIKHDLSYLVFHYNNTNEDNSLSFAYAINHDGASLSDRIYATYFVDTYSALLEVSTGCLVNTRAINSSRSGLERENEKEPAILKTIKHMGKKTIDDLIAILNDSSSSEAFKRSASDVLCHLLCAYSSVQYDDEDDLLPKGIFEGTADALTTLCSNNKLYLDQDKRYIFLKDVGDNIDDAEKKININRPAIADDNNCQALYDCYNRIFVGCDLIVYGEEDYKQLPAGIRMLSSKVLNTQGNKNEVVKSWLIRIQLPFITRAQELITKRIGGDSFDPIMTFISNQAVQDQILIKQLIARFGIDKSFDYMGNYSNHNVTNWLFFSKDKTNDKAFQEACKEYDKSYSDLKELLKERIYTLHSYESYHWNAYADLWYSEFHVDTYSGITINENHIMQFLSLLSKGLLQVGFNNDYGALFIHDATREITLRNYNRNRATSGWNGKLRYFTIHFLNCIILNFNLFKSIRQTIDEYNSKCSPKYQINDLRRCNIQETNLSLVSDIFKWLSGYTESVSINIKSKIKCEFQNTDIVKFVQSILGDIHIRLERIDSGGNRAHFLGYVLTSSNNFYTIKVMKSAEAKFLRISTEDLEISPGDHTKVRELIVFYSNQDEQSALSAVLHDMQFGDEIPYYINHFINTSNYKQLSSYDYDKYLKRPEMKYKYPFEIEEPLSFMSDANKLKMEDIYTILSSEMSYDDHCPICNDVPTLNIQGTKIASANTNTLVVIIPAQYEGETVYVKTICCKSCFEEHKASLTSAQITKGDHKLFYTLELKNTISDASRSYDFVTKLLLSPDNWRIISDSISHKPPIIT